MNGDPPRNAQSALEVAGRGADELARLFGLMAAGAALIWVVFVGLLLYAYLQRRPIRRRAAQRLVWGAGVAFPSTVLTALLAYALSMLPGMLAPAPDAALRIHVTGQQWWWRVRYVGVAGREIELANEIRLPVGRPVELLLDSADVIHSFWIPSLGGKMDMIPGRQTRLRLEPIRVGTYRGVCAEYCGASHAWMYFAVVVQEEKAFERWLAAQAAPARVPDAPLAKRGAHSFIDSGCGACHTIRGTLADGVIGPDLTHVGSRLWLGAGRLSNHAGDFREWIARTDEVKPSVRMPPFGMLPPERLEPLAAYLETLQ